MRKPGKSLLLQALTLWRAITGIDPQAKKQTIGDWRLRETFTELQEAIDLDASEITAHLLLTHFLNSYLAEREVNLLTLLNDPQSVAVRLEKPRVLMDLLNRPELVEAREAFVASIAQAMERYGAAERADVQTLLASHDSIALLRRDALRAIEKLRADQFLDGTPEPEGFQPVYVKTVHQFWNVQSMLAACMRMPSGVSLNLVRHPQSMQSFFAFVIRNGGNLFVLSDVPEFAHPLQATMSRKPERELERRASRNWFPYDLLGLDYDETSGRLYVKATKERGLVAVQNVALPLKPFAELEPETLVWCSMLMELIWTKFWRQGWKAPQLSYTADQLDSSATLLEHAKTANLPVLAYQHIGLAPLRKADVAADAVTDDEVGRKGHEPNRWLEDRYAMQVPDEALNLIAAPEKVFALDQQSGAISTVGGGYQGLSDWQQERELGRRIQLVKLDATSFGSREQIQADRKYIARANFARTVRALAVEEFESRKDEVVAWYAGRVRANAANLLRWCRNDALWLDEGQQATFSHYTGSVGAVRTKEVEGAGMHRPRTVTRQLLKRHKLDPRAWEARLHASGVVLGGVKNGKLQCHLDGSVASYWVGIYPANSSELALVAGCTVSELPDVLQHWDLLDTYTGNSILDRIDPMIWSCRNPWLKLKLSILIPFSKRAMARIDKAPLERPSLPNLIAEDGSA